MQRIVFLSALLVICSVFAAHNPATPSDPQPSIGAAEQPAIAIPSLLELILREHSFRPLLSIVSPTGASKSTVPFVPEPSSTTTCAALLHSDGGRVAALLAKYLWGEVSQRLVETPDTVLPLCRQKLEELRARADLVAKSPINVVSCFIQMSLGSDEKQPGWGFLPLMNSSGPAFDLLQGAFNLHALLSAAPAFARWTAIDQEGDFVKSSDSVEQQVLQLYQYALMAEGGFVLHRSHFSALPEVTSVARNVHDLLGYSLKELREHPILRRIVKNLRNDLLDHQGMRDYKLPPTIFIEDAAKMLAVLHVPDLLIELGTTPGEAVSTLLTTYGLAFEGALLEAFPRLPIEACRQVLLELRERLGFIEGKHLDGVLYEHLYNGQRWQSYASFEHIQCFLEATLEGAHYYGQATLDEVTSLKERMQSAPARSTLRDGYDLARSLFPIPAVMASVVSDVDRSVCIDLQQQPLRICPAMRYARETFPFIVQSLTKRGGSLLSHDLSTPTKLVMRNPPRLNRLDSGEAIPIEPGSQAAHAKVDLAVGAAVLSQLAGELPLCQLPGCLQQVVLSHSQSSCQIITLVPPTTTAASISSNSSSSAGYRAASTAKAVAERVFLMAEQLFLHLGVTCEQDAIKAVESLMPQFGDILSRPSHRQSSVSAAGASASSSSSAFSSSTVSYTVGDVLKFALMDPTVYLTDSTPARGTMAEPLTQLCLTAMHALSMMQLLDDRKMVGWFFITVPPNRLRRFIPLLAVPSLASMSRKVDGSLEDDALPNMVKHACRDMANGNFRGLDIVGVFKTVIEVSAWLPLSMAALMYNELLKRAANFVHDDADYTDPSKSPKLVMQRIIEPLLSPLVSFLPRAHREAFLKTVLQPLLAADVQLAGQGKSHAEVSQLITNYYSMLDIHGKAMARPKQKGHSEMLRERDVANGLAAPDILAFVKQETACSLPPSGAFALAKESFASRILKAVGLRPLKPSGDHENCVVSDGRFIYMGPSMRPAIAVIKANNTVQAMEETSAEPIKVDLGDIVVVIKDPSDFVVVDVVKDIVETNMREDLLMFTLLRFPVECFQVAYLQDLLLPRDLLAVEHFYLQKPSTF